MAVNIPTTQEQADTNQSNFESRIGQDAPLNDKAFITVQAIVEALQFTSLYKYAAERVIQNFAQTATGEDLDRIGVEYGVVRTPAQSAVLTATLNSTSVIPQTTTFKGDANGETYFLSNSVTPVAGVATLSLTSQTTGEAGNLNVSDTLTISNQIAGAETQATVTVVDTIGVDEESDDDYRLRILDKIRSQGGGGNAADYRNWSEEPAGVKRTYPYSGRPVADPSAPPPARTVFVEAETSIDPDGLAPASLIQDVIDSITTDPITGEDRQPLGLTNDTLYVESIVRTSLFVEVRNLNVSPSLESQVKQNIETALTLYFSSITCFVDGLDPIFERNDTITDLVVSDIVQDVLKANSASATGVGFGTSPGSFVSIYQLDPGELSKLGGVTYV